ncbi:transglutaminase domain-containing protein [Flammeovirga pectinis]|uniref:Transglutaminase domain-containing protein n=1 Tax=Flammeovirga pectinis TaxID=2494373 RepID=A0A3S9NZ05_9BACT|nr:transglutaminase-like domain-containing protein [Flammeovirga pectinis]AZQ61171.1 transglutaminase domain-containing protein [Flammeovirga pectinis]
MKQYLKETQLLNFNHAIIQRLIKNKKWIQLSDIERVQSIYNFVRDEIKFGYNSSDQLTATTILTDGIGQCNTKATLLMALLRGVNIPNRIHGFTIDKTLQKGAISGLWYTLSPKNILHSWVEVYVNNTWYFLEGVILDKQYLQQLKKKNKDCTTSFCGFGVFTEDLNNPAVDWYLNNTYIQNLGINNDFGLFNSPDDFYKQHRQKMGPMKRFFYRNFIRHSLNITVNKIRNNYTV